MTKTLLLSLFALLFFVACDDTKRIVDNNVLIIDDTRNYDDSLFLSVNFHRPDELERFPIEPKNCHAYYNNDTLLLMLRGSPHLASAMTIRCIILPDTFSTLAKSSDCTPRRLYTPYFEKITMNKKTFQVGDSLSLNFNCRYKYFYGSNMLMKECLNASLRGSLKVKIEPSKYPLYDYGGYLFPPYKKNVSKNGHL